MHAKVSQLVHCGQFLYAQTHEEREASSTFFAYAHYSIELMVDI